MSEGLELEYYYHALPDWYKWLMMFILSDFHYGNQFCDKQRIKDQVEFIRATENCRIILTGDLCESTIRTSKGDIFKQVGDVDSQRGWVTETLLPIKDQILGMCPGNHEARIYNETGHDPTKQIAKDLGVPYDPDGIIIAISFGNRNNNTDGKPWFYMIDCTHGYGGARTKSAKAVKVERQGQFMRADVHTMAHDHVVNVAPDVSLEPDMRRSPQKVREDGEHKGELTGFITGKVRARRKMLVKTNAYFKWGGYGRRLGFGPVDMVSPTILFSGEEKPWFLQRASDKWEPEVRVIV